MAVEGGEHNENKRTAQQTVCGTGRYVLASLVLLSPCYWQPRLQAGDLSSHIYNAWLSHLIENGQAEGLTIARQSTNVLFDLLLGALFTWFGAGAAQRIAVSIAVLVFIWGSFAFISRVAGNRPWHLLPCLAMLAYGWVFHMGFFNFYLSIGICFWVLSLAWDLRARGLALAAPLVLLAYLAHALPVVWMAGLMFYVFLARRLNQRYRLLLSGGVIAAMALLHLVLARTMSTRWSPAQITVATGVDQVWVFDVKYFIVMMGLASVWGLMLFRVARYQGVRQMLSSIPFHLCLICAGSIAVLPGRVFIPGFLNALSFIAERMSLGLAICVCALVASARPGRVAVGASVVVALAFFSFVYADERALNSFEDRMRSGVAGLPAGSRVVSPILDLSLRTNPLSHMVDRVCIGHCFSYGNYEPSTGQFRIRAREGNGIVVARYADSWGLQTGEYVVAGHDLPLFRIGPDRDGRMLLEQLKAGAKCGSTFWKTLPDLLPIS